MDIEINRDCVVRKNPDGTYGERFELRVGEPNWHRNAALLTEAEARALYAELVEFLGERNGDG